MAYDDRALRGVGGWLAFLIVILGVVSPLRLAVEAIVIFSLRPGASPALGANLVVFKAVEAVVLLARLAGSLYLAWRLYAVHLPRTVRAVVIGLWLLSVGLVAIELPALILLTDMPMAALTKGLAVSLVQGTIFATVWTAYLLRSRRVANTYTADHDSGEVFA